MKILTIAVKDLTRSFRSAFSIVFMFVIPLLVTGMFYLMFGNMSEDDEAAIPATKVVVVNLDKGSSQLGNMGEQFINSIQADQLASIMDVSVEQEVAKALEKLDAQEAGVILVIPEDFTADFSDQNEIANVDFLQDPTLTVGPQIVSSVVNQILDAFAGIRIEVAEILKLVEAGKISPDQISPLVDQYVALSMEKGDENQLIETRTPQMKPETSFLVNLVGPIMGGMMIFYAFFTGVNTANSILHEDEDGTLPRLFTTPTSQREILAGKFLSVGLTVIVQVLVLLISASLLFGIYWGSFAVVAFIVLGLICAATSFGILVCSFLKNTKQGGIIFGGLLTVTGMLGMINVFTGNTANKALSTASLFVPQGWACQALLASMNGAGIEKTYPYVLVLIAMSVVFFVVGVWRFQKRYE